MKRMFVKFLFEASLGLSLSFAVTLHAQMPLYTQWQSYVGANVGATDVTYAVTMDLATNLYLSGTSFYGNIDNISGVYADTSYYNDDTGGENLAYIAKANAQGQLLWNITAGIGNMSAITALIETNGFLYGVGQFFQMPRNGSPLPQSEAVLLKLNSETGTPAWGQDDIYTYTRFLVDETASPTNRYNTQNAFRVLALDSDQNIYAAGYTTMSNLNLTSSTSYQGAQDGVVAKYSSNGVCQWIRYLGGSGREQVNGITVGPDNIIYVVGETQSTNWISQSSLNPALYKCGFLVKLDAQGTLLSQKLFGASNGSSYLTAIRCESTSNRVWIAGSTASSNLCRTALNAFSGSWDGYVMNLSDQGSTYTTNWCRYIGGITNEDITAMTLLPGNRTLIGGVTFSSGWLEATPSSTTAAGGADGFLIQLDSNGTPLWANYQGGARDDRVLGISALNEKCVATVGRTRSLPAPEHTWIFGGFNNDWAKSSDGETIDLDANMTYGFASLMTTIPGEPPSITQDPASVTKYEGEDATFTITATGFAPLKYAWYCNNVRITEAQTNTLTTPALLPSNNNDVYFCIVSNYYGIATSQTARVTVIANGTITIAITNGPSSARWSIDDGTTWQTSGTTLALRPGTFTVSFNTLDGWISPSSEQITLNAGATIQKSVAYAPIVASAVRNISNTNVSLTVTASAGVTNWIVTETIPVNMTPNNTVGSWNSTARTLTFTSTNGTSLSYQLTVTNNGIYTLTGTILSQPSDISQSVSGDSQVIRADFYRSIVGSNIYITVSDSFTNKNFLLTETLPNNLSVVLDSISPAGGNYNSDDNYIEWYKIKAKTFHYMVSGDTGTYFLNGSATIIGSSTYPIIGNDTVTISAPLPPPATPPIPNIIQFVPIHATFALTFTSLVNQTYLIQTNANGLKDGQGALIWGTYKNVQGSGPLTQETVEQIGSNMLFRIIIPE